MHIEKLPSGSTRVTISTGKKDKNGKYIRKCFVDKDPKKAIRAASEYMDEHRGDDPDAGTFGHAAERYIQTARKRLSPSTIREYTSRKNTLEDRYSAFYNTPVDRITRRALQNLVNDLPCTPKTIRNYIGFISAVMKDAGYNPPVVKLPEPAAPDLRVPEPCEVEWLLKLAEGTVLEVPILLAAYGTLREGEICALTMDDVSEEGVIVRRDMVVNDDNAVTIKPTPKNAQSRRFVSLPAWITDRITGEGCDKVVKTCRLDSSVTEIHNFVTPLIPRQLSNRFTRFVNTYGFEYFSFHRLRAFSVSELSSLGVPEEYLLARGGWKTDHIMKSHYRRTLQTRADEVNEMIKNHYSEKNFHT